MKESQKQITPCKEPFNALPGFFGRLESFRPSTHFPRRRPSASLLLPRLARPSPSPGVATRYAPFYFKGQKNEFYLPWHFLNFALLPHQHGSFLPGAEGFSCGRRSGAVASHHDFTASVTRPAGSSGVPRP